jgi:hypothetical protein
MLRTQNLFALTSIVLLALGLLTSQFAFASRFTFQAGAQNRGYAFSLEMPLYCIAALFAAFAFLYSIGYIPFTSAMPRWHFWLSLVSVVVCVAGAAIFSWQVSRNTTDTTLGLGGTLLAASFAAGLVTFVSMQLWFTVDLARALWKMHAT